MSTYRGGRGTAICDTTIKVLLLGRLWEHRRQTIIAPENFAEDAIEIRQASPVLEIGQPRSPHHPIELVLCPLECLRVQNHGKHEVQQHRRHLLQIMHENTMVTAVIT